MGYSTVSEYRIKKLFTQLNSNEMLHKEYKS